MQLFNWIWKCQWQCNDNAVNCKCLLCNRFIQKRLKNRFKISNDNNISFSLLRKGLDPYEFIGDWQKINEKSLVEKEKLYTSLHMEDIKDSDCNHEKKYFFWKRKIRWISWLVSKNWDIITTWCFRKLYKKVLRNLWIRSGKLFLAPGLAQ